MAASTSTAGASALIDDGSRLRAVVDRTAKEVKDYTSQFEDQYKLVEALGTAVNLPENKGVLDILAVKERRLDAALARENTAAANLTAFCVAESSVLQAQAAAAAPAPVFSAPTVPATTPSKSVADKKIMKRKLPEPIDGWKDASGKTHRAHLDAMTFHKTVAAILWQLMDMVHGQTSGGSTPTPDVPLASLIPLVTMEENMQNYTVLELLQMGLNCVHESAHSVYLKHVYNGTVAETFLGDNLFGADRTIPIEDRVDSAVNRVQKLSAATKAAIGKTGRGGSSTVKRGGAAGRGGSSYNGGMQRNYDSDYRQRDYSYGRSNNGASGSYGGSGNNRDNGQRTCFICGSTWHQAKQCSKGN